MPVGKIMWGKMKLSDYLRQLFGLGAFPKADHCAIEPGRGRELPESQSRATELSQSIKDDIRAAEPGWCNSFVECGRCGHQWMSIFPVECPVQDIQCSQCNQQGQSFAITEEDYDLRRRNCS